MVDGRKYKKFDKNSLDFYVTPPEEAVPWRVQGGKWRVGRDQNDGGRFASLFKAGLNENIHLGTLDRILLEELTKSDKKEIEKLAKKQARKEIDKVVGSSLEKTIEKEVKKILKTKATRQELGDITKAVFKKLYRDLALRSPHIIDRIKV